MDKTIIDKADRKTEPFAKDINVRGKDEPQTELKGPKRLLKGKDEPQTERSE